MRGWRSSTRAAAASTAARSETSHSSCSSASDWRRERPTTSMPRACSARTSSAPMPGRGAGDDGYLQTLNSRGRPSACGRTRPAPSPSAVLALRRGPPCSRHARRHRPGRTCRCRSGACRRRTVTCLIFFVDPATTTSRSFLKAQTCAGGSIQVTVGPFDDGQLRLLEGRVREDVVPDRVDVLGLLVVGGRDDRRRRARLELRAPRSGCRRARGRRPGRRRRRRRATPS